MDLSFEHFFLMVFFVLYLFPGRIELERIQWLLLSSYISYLFLESGEPLLAILSLLFSIVIFIISMVINISEEFKESYRLKKKSISMLKLISFLMIPGVLFSVFFSDKKPIEQQAQTLPLRSFSLDEVVLAVLIILVITCLSLDWRKKNV